MKWTTLVPWSLIVAGVIGFVFCLFMAIYGCTQATRTEPGEPRVWAGEYVTVAPAGPALAGDEPHGTILEPQWGPFQFRAVGEVSDPAARLKRWHQCWRFMRGPAVTIDWLTESCGCPCAIAPTWDLRTFAEEVQK